ncbi:hypothetical protein N2152v2_008072 [Parachlorella kessleri]
MAFAHRYQTERPVLPGTTLTLRLRPLAPNKDLLLLQRLEWLLQPAPCHLDSGAKETAEFSQAEGYAQDSSAQLLDPANGAAVEDAAPAAPAGPAADQCQGGEQAGQEQQEAAAAAQAVERPQSLETPRLQRGMAGAGDGGGGSQMDEIRSLLRTVASQGAPGGNPRQALLAAVARSALVAPPSGTTSGGSSLQPPAMGSAAAGLAPAAGVAPGLSRQTGGGGGASSAAGVPAFVAALMQATSLSRVTTQGQPRQATGPAAQQAGQAGLPTSQPGFLGDAGGPSSPSLPGPQGPPGLVVAGGAAFAPVPMQWLSGELAQLEERLMGRLEASLRQLEARLGSSAADTPGIQGYQIPGHAGGAALLGVMSEAAGGAASLPGGARGSPAERRQDGGSLVGGALAAFKPALEGRLRGSEEMQAAAELPSVLEGRLRGSEEMQAAAAAELPPALEGRLACLEGRLAAVEDLCRQILSCVQHDGGVRD